MKKVTLISLLMVFAAWTFAQNAISHKNVLTPDAYKKGISMENANKAVIWSDDFTTPANWTIAHEAGTTGDWVIGTGVPSGSYAIPGLTSTSGGNFALFDSDLICSGNQVANLTTASSINLTGHSQVMVTFEEMYRRWYDSTFVYVSTNGTTWTKFPVNAAYVNNDMSSNPAVVSVNISSAIAANPATVWIRFTFYSPSAMGASAGCGYAWMIDDVQIIDALTNDVSLANTYADFFGFSYYEWTPVSQLVDVDLGGIVTNNGSAAQTAVTLHVEDAGNALTGTYVANTLASGADSNMVYNAALASATANVWGVKYWVTQTETDEVVANNAGDSVYFGADPNMYLRSTSLTSLLTPYSFGAGAPATTGMEFGCNYHFMNNDRVDSIVVLIYGANGTGTVTGKLYTVDIATMARTEVGTTAPYTPSGVPELKTLALTTPYTVAAGTFLTGTAKLTFNVGANDTIKLGADGDYIGDAGIGGAAYLNVSSAWGWYYVTGTVPVVGLMVYNNSDVNDLVASKDLAVYPNPASDQLYILNEKASLVEIFTITGEKVAEYKNMNVVNISGIAQGSYIVKVTTDSKVITEKINVVR
jgi:hypothetical protein